jgi:hypothetical protein
MKMKVKLAEILHRLHAQYGKEILSCANVYDRFSNFSEGHEEALSSHSTSSCMWCEHLLYQRADFGKHNELCGIPSGSGINVGCVEAITYEHLFKKNMCPLGPKYFNIQPEGAACCRVCQISSLI